MVFNSFRFPGDNICENWKASSFCGAANSKPRRQICKTKQLPTPVLLATRKCLKMKAAQFKQIKEAHFNCLWHQEWQIDEIQMFLIVFYSPESVWG